MRRRLFPDQRLRSSLRAAIGGILDALLAGEIAANKVTPMPTMAAATPNSCRDDQGAPQGGLTHRLLEL
ncbi:MAG: hypothetical protein Ct9H300mP26_4510 [Acidimicrobiales bacterium]|nr:MAG: hypothetical protein Ct9H300mP26_4510 [Acidimicrobiales bacterium]